MSELFHRKIERSADRLRHRDHRGGQRRRHRRDRAAVHHRRNRRAGARHAGLHAARAGGPQHLRPRGLLRLPQPDDPDAARRGRTLRPVFAGRGIPVRPADAVGVQADGSRPRPGGRQILGFLARRAPDQSARRRSGIEHARLRLARPHAAEDRRPSAASGGPARARRALHRGDGRERRPRRLRTGDARHAISRPE